MLSGADNAPVRERLADLSIEALQKRASSAEAELYNLGITFTVYSDKNAIDRILPFDVIPRLITAADWAVIEAGVRQRVQTLNLFRVTVGAAALAGGVAMASVADTAAAAIMKRLEDMVGAPGITCFHRRKFAVLQTIACAASKPVPSHRLSPVN